MQISIKGRAGTPQSMVCLGYGLDSRGFGSR